MGIYFAIFAKLCEASPESVLRKLESEIEVSQGLIDLFAEKVETL